MPTLWLRSTQVENIVCSELERASGLTKYRWDQLDKLLLHQHGEQAAVGSVVQLRQSLVDDPDGQVQLW